MKKRLRRLTFALLALLTLLPLLAITPIVGADALPTYEGTCSKCGRITFNLVGYEPNYTPGTHSPLYKCPNCNYWARVGERYEYCSGGTATCTEKAKCSVCGGEYGELASHEMVHYDRKYATCTEGGWNEHNACKNCGYSPDKKLTNPMFHDMDDYTSDGNNKTHTRRCRREGCNTTDTQDCTNVPGNRPTCVTPGPCMICGGNYLGGHTYYGPFDSDPDKHWRECIYCNDAPITGSHSFEENQISEATCISPAVYGKKCSVCDYQLTVTRGDKNPDKHDLADHAAKTPTCTEIGWNAYETCKRKGCGYTTYVVQPALNHNLVSHDAKAPTCTEKGWNAYDTCTRCDYTTYAELSALNHDLVHHDAKTPTCTEVGWNAYDTCTRCDYTTYVELPIAPDNHALIHVKAQAPTCTNHGWDAYDICQRCGYTTFKELPALGHWYGEWTPNGDGTQIAACKRGCGHKAAVKCAEQEYTLPMGEGEETYEFTLCPVCGQVSDGTKLALVEKATAKAVTRWLPAGEAVLRLGTLENGEIVLIAGFEYAGQLTQPTGQVQFTLPAEHLKGFTLTVVNADGTEEPLDYTTEKDKATFTLDFTDTKIPTILIHLTPEA